MAFPTRFPPNAFRQPVMDSMRHRLWRSPSRQQIHAPFAQRFPAGPAFRHPYFGLNKKYGLALGDAVSNCIKATDGDTYELLEALRVYKTYSRNIASVIRAVNAVLTPMNFDEVVFTTCGHIVLSYDTVADHSDELWCEECANDELVEVVDGNGLYPRDDVYMWESDGEYHRREEPEEEEDDYEESSSNRSEDHDSLYRWGASTSDLAHDEALQDAASKFGSFPIGVELEVESDEDDLDSAVANTRRHFGGTESSYAMLKTDGSLGEHGFEIVTAARSLADHISRFESWRPHSSLTAWSNGRCGVHVHIDSRAFTSLTLGKFINFINDRDNATFIKSIAGRHPRDGGKAADYCAQLSQPMGAKPTVHLKRNGTSHTSRYRMVNVTNLSYSEMGRLGIDARRDCKGNYSTVELRIFRASLKKERLLAQIEFAHASVLFCRTAAWHQLTGDAFVAWLRTGDAAQYKHLRRWFGINLPKANKKSATVRSTAEV